MFLPLQTSYNLLSVRVYFKAGLLVTILYFTSRNLLLPEMISLESLVRDDRTRNAISGLSRISDRTLISAFNNTESKVHRRKCHCPNWCSSVSKHIGSVFCWQSCRVRRTARARDDTQARIMFCFEMFSQQFYPEMYRATTGCYPFAIRERWPKHSPCS